jgi:hypothetical protein
MGDRLHPACRPLLGQQTYGGGIAGKRPCGKGIDLYNP